MQQVVALLVTLLVMLAVVALVLIAVAAFLLLPVAVTASTAERRGLDPARWSALAVAGVVVAGVLAYSLSRVAAPLAVLVLLSWVIPLVVRSRDEVQATGQHRAGAE